MTVYDCKGCSFKTQMPGITQMYSTLSETVGGPFCPSCLYEIQEKFKCVCVKKVNPKCPQHGVSGFQKDMCNTCFKVNYLDKFYGGLCYSCKYTQEYEYVPLSLAKLSQSAQAVGESMKAVLTPSEHLAEKMKKFQEVYKANQPVTHWADGHIQHEGTAEDCDITCCFAKRKQAKAKSSAVAASGDVTVTSSASGKTATFKFNLDYSQVESKLLGQIIGSYEVQQKPWQAS